MDSLAYVKHVIYVHGFFVNILTLIILTRFRTHQDYQSQFDIIQTALDLTVSIIHYLSSLPLNTAPEMQRWNHFYCPILFSRSILWGLASVRGYLNLFASTHFFIKLALPFTQIDLLQRGPLWVMIMLSIYSFVLGTLPHTYKNDYGPDARACISIKSKSFSAHTQLGLALRSTVILTTVHNYLVPTSMMAYFYCQLFQLLRSSKGPGAEVVKKELLIRFLLDFCAYAVCYLPLYVGFFIGYYWYNDTFNVGGFAYDGTALVAAMYPSFYSLISLCTRQSYRQPCEEMMRLFCRRAASARSSARSSSSSVGTSESSKK